MKIKASAISVILNDSDSVHCYLEVNGESCNVTLRFDRGSKAQVCGYPMTWGIHDVGVEYYDNDSLTYAEYLNETGELPNECEVYISEANEVTILKALKRSISRQFKSKDWSKSCTKSRQNTILKLINSAIGA